MVGDKHINFSNPIPTPGRENLIPYVCTGNDAFPLSSYMMKTYPQKNLF